MPELWRACAAKKSCGDPPLASSEKAAPRCESGQTSPYQNSSDSRVPLEKYSGLINSCKISRAKIFSPGSPKTSLTLQNLAIMATNGDFSDEELSHSEEENDTHDLVHEEVEETNTIPKSALKKGTTAAVPIPEIVRPPLPEQPDPSTLDIPSLTPLTPEIIARQATINIGTIGHVAHGKSTVVKAISGVQTVRFKNELERNITIKLGYANAKIYRCDDESCPRPTCYKSFKSDKEVDPPCEREGCTGRYRLLRHVSSVIGLPTSTILANARIVSLTAPATIFS